MSLAITEPLYIRRGELAFEMNGTRPILPPSLLHNLPPTPHIVVYAYITNTNVRCAFKAALLLQRKRPPPPLRFQSCGLGFVYLDRGQFEHDRILKVFQHSPTSLFVSWQFLSSLPRFRLLHLCPPADFWFALGKTSILTHGPRIKLDCWDLINKKILKISR